MRRQNWAAEHFEGVLRFSITRIVSEDILIEDAKSYARELSLEGVVPDDIGVEGLAGRPASISFHGGRRIRLEANLDALHGVAEGSSIGVIDAHGSKVYMGVHVSSRVVAAMAGLVRRGTQDGHLWIEAAFASKTMGMHRPIEPRHILISPLKRVAVLRLSCGHWRGVGQS